MADEMSVSNDVVKKISSHFGLNENSPYDQWKISLDERINHLIIHDFDQLISLLYRIDVDETKLKTALRTTPLNAAEVIAEMIIERETLKWKLKNQ